MTATLYGTRTRRAALALYRDLVERGNNTPYASVSEQLHASADLLDHEHLFTEEEKAGR